MPEIKAGQRIAVYDGKRRELGEGTFIRAARHDDLNVTAYECEEHTILAQGDHYVRLEGRLHFVQSGLAT